MKLKKLAVAAMIAAGISTCAINNVMASCPCNEATKAPCPCSEAIDNCGCKDTDLSCDRKAQPACASCAQAEELTRKNMMQVYAYPNAVYGSNNVVGDYANSIYYGENKDLKNFGTIISSEEGLMTGAATQIPYLNTPVDSINGVPVLRDEAKMDNNSCPLEIHTENSMNALKKTYTPFDLNQSQMTGAAANIMGYFPDVPDGYWASCDIDKLAMNDVVVGYPDKKFKPTKNVTRAEFATMLVKGFNMDSCSLAPKCIFSDVPAGNWANPLIAKAVDENLMAGYPNGTFKPNNSVTRVEALTALAKGLNCQMDKCRAEEILSKYKDSHLLPDWAQIPIATAIDNGALKDLPSNNKILPNEKASRADIASMLQNVRVAGHYDNNPKTANDTCPLDSSKKAYLENEQVVKIPTLKLEFLDEVNAKSAHVGQRFAATSLEEVTINGQVYPCGSKVYGKVIEVIRPSGKQKGSLKLAFTEIKHNDCVSELPRQILTAQINKSKTPNPIARIVGFPFTWAGTLVGVAGRTTGGMIANLGNAVENISNGSGTALSETFQGEFKAAGRSLGDAIVETGKAPIDFSRTALSGTMGLFQTSGDEIAYVVDPKGTRISAINPKEHLTIAFGCKP